MVGDLGGVAPPVVAVVALHHVVVLRLLHHLHLVDTPLAVSTGAQPSLSHLYSRPGRPDDGVVLCPPQSPPRSEKLRTETQTRISIKIPPQFLLPITASSWSRLTTIGPQSPVQWKYTEL